MQKAVEKREWLNAGVLFMVFLAVMSVISGVALAQTNSTTNSTDTTTTINWNIDTAPLINMVIALLPAVLAIAIVKMLFEQLGRFGKFVNMQKVHGTGRWLLKTLPMALLAISAAFSTALAQTDTTTSSIDVSSLISIVISLMPLIIVLVIIKAIMSAFKGLG